jgi:hypothetical protein
MILKIFSPKSSAKKMAFLTQNKAKLCKISIITSTPGWASIALRTQTQFSFRTLYRSIENLRMAAVGIFPNRKFLFGYIM